MSTRGEREHFTGRGRAQGRRWAMAALTVALLCPVTVTAGSAVAQAPAAPLLGGATGRPTAADALVAMRAAQQERVAPRVSARFDAATAARSSARAGAVVSDAAFDVGSGYADLLATELGFGYDGGSWLYLFNDVRTFSNPYSDQWRLGLTGGVWYIDVNGDGYDDYVAGLLNSNGSLYAVLYDGAIQNLLCTGQFAYSSIDRWYSVRFPSSCVNNAAMLRWQGEQDYDTYYSDNVPTYYDYAPNASYSGFVDNTPLAPGTPVGTPGANSVALSWSAPAYVGAYPVTDYVVQYSTNAGSSWTTFADGTSTSTSTTVTGLATVSHVFRVAAVSPAGTGDWSAASAPVTPLAAPTPPSLPGKPWATPGVGSALVEWTAPASAGTAPISDYIVQYSSDSGTNWTAFADGTSSATSTTVTGLDAATSYIFRIAATNAAGTSLWSLTSAPVATFAVPGAPAAPSALGIAGGVFAQWLAPASTGGTGVTSYVVQYRPSVLAPTTVTSTPRIVGGSIVDIANYPWQVNLQVGPYLCGGSLIDPSWVVTASHCVNGYGPGDMIVHAGINQMTAMNAGNGVAVSQVIMHPLYDSTTKANDIALLHLSAPATGGTPIALYTNTGGPALNTPAVISGWGTTSSGGSVSNDLRAATVDVLAAPGDACGSYGSSFQPALMLCAGKAAGGIDTCQGDSGGPLAIDVAGEWQLAGITSFGTGCAQAAYPGVYTRVSTYNDWVRGYVPAPAGEWQSVGVSCAGLPPCTYTDVTGLTDGNQYDVRVAAVNAVGQGPWSAIVGPVTAGAADHGTVPDAPTGATATPRDGRAIVSWTPPASDGGAPIADYRVTVTDAAGGPPAGVNGPVTRLAGGAVTSMLFTGLTNGTTYRFVVEARNVTGWGPTSDPSPTTVPGPQDYVGLTPARLLDTRSGAKQPAGSTFTLQVGGQAGVPANPTAVVLNVTAVLPAAKGFLTVYPCDESRPNASNVNYVAGVNIPNLVMVKPSATGTVCIYTSQTTHLLADVSGYMPPPAPYIGLTPARLLDTRLGIGTTIDHQYEQIGQRPAGTALTLPANGRGGIAGDAAAVVLNVTAVNPTAKGYITVYPCDQPQPNASNLNYAVGVNIANLVIVRPSATGWICLFTSQATDLLVDVAGYMPASATYQALVPARVLDTRAAGETIDDIWEKTGQRSALTVLTLPVRSRGGVAAEFGAVVINVTAVNPASVGYVTAYPCDQAMPNASNLNFTAGVNIPNLVIVKPAANGTVCLYTSAAVDLIVDVAGSFSPI